MQTFASCREAKEFLVGNIVAEAQREGVPLSDIERKMLYFSESAWTLPDIAEVNEAFDRDYDQAEYERKVAKLIRNLRADTRPDSPAGADAWMDAVRCLRHEDHYLLVLIDAAGKSGRPRGDLLKLLLTALAIVGAAIGVALLMAR